MPILPPLAGLGLLQAPSPEVPPLAAEIRHEQRLLTADGLEKVVRYRERLARSGGHVWLERVLPPQAPAPGPGGHLHGDGLATAARHLVRQPDGGLKLEFVRRADRVIFETDRRDWPEVGFDGSWERAACLLDAAERAKLAPLPEKAPAGAVWLGREDDREFLRVLWSTTWALPLVMESGRKDGTAFYRTTVEPGPRPAALPWEALEGLRRRDYTDLLD